MGNRMIDAGYRVSGRVRALLGYSCESEVARLVRLGGSRGALSCVTWGSEGGLWGTRGGTCAK